MKKEVLRNYIISQLLKISTEYSKIELEKLEISELKIKFFDCLTRLNFGHSSSFF